MLKKILVVLAGVVVSLNAYAKVEADRDISGREIKSALLILDMRNVPSVPRNFRGTNKMLTDVNTTGLSDLHMVGSAQFSAESLKQVLSQLHTKRLTIFDLRQESHAFLDNNAVSWYASQNAANAYKSDAAIEREQWQLLAGLEQREEVKVYKVLGKNENENITFARPTDYTVRLVQSEEELAQEMHQRYQRLYVQDFHAPSDKQVDRFMQMVSALPKDGWVYFHCRAGVGRTTTFMVMYDMLRNAKKVSFDDIIKRQSLLGGKDLLEMPPKDNFKYPLAVERLDFLKRFYQYAHDNTDNFATKWSRYKAG